LNTLLRSSDFDEWLSHLADQKAKARILARLTGAALGNFGDCETVGEGVSEMRIHVGPGYRVYHMRTGSTVYVLLAGGTKASQAKDIAKAKRMARELRRSKQQGKQ
jgi:putative addiction module killer protein